MKKHFQNIVGYDPVVSKEEIEKLGVVVSDLESGFSNADCIIIVNNHQSYQSMNIEKLLQTSHKDCIFVDCWALFDKLKSNPNSGTDFNDSTCAVIFQEFLKSSWS